MLNDDDDDNDDGMTVWFVGFFWCANNTFIIWTTRRVKIKLKLVS